MTAVEVVVFGSQRIAAIWTLRNRVDPNKVRLATHSADRIRGAKGTITVVRVSEEAWVPPTNPCAQRVRDTEGELRDFKKRGGIVIEEVMK